MYQFFVENEQVYGDEVHITGSDVRHIGQVLRMKCRDQIRVSDSSGRAFFCSIQTISQDEVVARIERVDETGTELSVRVYLFQGLPKADKMELIIQKAVELGVHEVIPVAMKNCVVKLEEKKISSRITRWQTIAESAAKQSKRTIIPVVNPPRSFKQALAEANALDLVLVPYENERGMEATREILSAIKPGMSVGIMIGPEGGFAGEEILAASGMGEKFHRISLGRRILRTETAGMATLAMLVYQLDE